MTEYSESYAMNYGNPRQTGGGQLPMDYSIKSPMEVVLDTSSGTIPRVDVNNVKVEDGVFSTATVGGAVYDSQWIKCTNFGYNLPRTGTITSITVTIKGYVWKSQGVPKNYDLFTPYVKIVTANGILPTIYYPFNATTVNTKYTVEFNISALGLTAFDLNDPKFGIMVGGQVSGKYSGSNIAYIDSVAMAITTPSITKIATIGQELNGLTYWTNPMYVGSTTNYAYIYSTGGMEGPGHPISIIEASSFGLSLAGKTYSSINVIVNAYALVDNNAFENNRCYISRVDLVKADGTIINVSNVNTRIAVIQYNYDYTFTLDTTSLGLTDNDIQNAKIRITNGRGLDYNNTLYIRNVRLKVYYS